MKLAVPFELRIFLVVVLVGIISTLVILDTPVREQHVFTSQVVQGLQQPEEETNTVIISGIDIGQAIGFKTPTLSAENKLLCLADRKITTDRGRATVKYFLSLYDTMNGGCTFEFAETEDRRTGAFMRCRSSQKAFDFTMYFEPSLDSDLDGDDAEDLLGESFFILGAVHSLVKAKVHAGTGTVSLRFIGPAGTIDLEDNYADTAFSDDVRVNGKRAMEGFVRIRATASNDEFRIQSIEYRFMPKPKLGKDVFVPDHQGLKQYLDTPEAVWGDFDILFKISGVLPKVSVPRAPISTRYGGNIIMFDAVGDDTYNMIFTNNQGRTYTRVPVVSVVGGSLKYGDDDQDFEFSGAGFVVDRHDIFAVTSKATRTGVTNILEYSSIDFTNGNIYLNDRAGGDTVGHFDTTTGEGKFIAGGTEFDIDVDTAEPHSIAIDFDNNGAVGGEAEIVTAGGPRIDLAGGFSGALEIDATLFADEAPAGGETINFAFSQEAGDIDVAVTSGVSLIKNDVSGFNEGLSTFGVFVQLGDRDTANDLILNMPGGMGLTGGVVAGITGDAVYTGQLQAEVLITCERSEFVKRAQAAKAKK